MAGAKSKLDNSKMTGRRPSQSEEVNLRDILKEIQRLAIKQDEYQKEAQTKLDKQSIQQREICEELLEMKKEFREEMGLLKKEMMKTNKEINNLKMENMKIVKQQNTLQKKMDDFEQKNEKIEKLEKLQEKFEQNEREFQLRFRNVQEEAKEDIRQLVTKMLANLLKRTEENMDNEIDKIYRVQTNFSRRNKVARDIIVHFVKKRIRDEILIQNSRNPMYHKGKKVIVLKEFPQATLNRRRKFFFLTDELKRLKIRFRWEKKEGIMVTYKEEKHWLTSEDKAKDFYKRYIKGKSEIPSETTPPSVKRKKAKRARHHSEEKQKSKMDSFYKLVNVTDEGEDEGSEEEEERDEKEAEEEEEGIVTEKEQESEEDKARTTPDDPHETDDE
nr:PREDICTED: glutamic acid-rich protein-like [Anolis carolinensis]|eukprot:XP_016851678.1 PREDICTED: glutamic acid-rich protein-like [Anolis carolinensis]